MRDLEKLSREGLLSVLCVGEHREVNRKFLPPPRRDMITDQQRIGIIIPSQEQKANAGEWKKGLAIGFGREWAEMCVAKYA